MTTPPMQNMPSGLVTFVMTDIEGSTRWMRALGARYVGLLQQHNRLLRECWTRHDGWEVDTSGDGFLVAFADAQNALKACADGLQRISAESWTDGVKLKVRMGLHTGFAAPHGDDYIALAVHLTARITDAAHGGQALLSPQTVAALPVPADPAVRSLGRFRVRDFDAPVELWQLEGSEVLAPRVVPADRHNLLKPSGGFFGRRSEVEQLATAVTAGRCLTLVGPGGIGKTRLAIEFGLSATEQWPGGVWFTDLANVVSGADVPEAIARSLGITVRGTVDASESLLEGLEARSALLIIDNAEHLRDATSLIVGTILRKHPQVAVLATSRQSLGLRAEVVSRVGSLAIDRRDEGAPAIELFCERAAAVDESWNPSGFDLQVVAELCRRLDGLPLAIEMAAARTSGFTPSEILEALDTRGATLGTIDPSVELRHRSLEQLIDWSEQLLSSNERIVFQSLAIFAGNFSCDVVGAAVGHHVPAAMIPDIIWSLTSKSLVSTEQAAGSSRYRLLQTVRNHVRNRIADDEFDLAVRRLASWYLDRIGPGLALDRRWIGMMADELDNVRGLIPSLVYVDEPTGQRLAWSVATYLDLTEPYGLAIAEVDRYAQMLPKRTSERVGLLTRLADLQLRIGDVRHASTTLVEAADLQQAIGRTPWDDVSVERTTGELALREGRYVDARLIAEETLESRPTVRGQARMLNLLGISSLILGDVDSAITAFEGEVAAWGALGIEALQLSAYGNLAEAFSQRPDPANAAMNQLRCLDLAVQYGQPTMIAYSAITAAQLCASAGSWDQAARLQNAADRELARMGIVLLDTDRAQSNDLLAAAANHLDSTIFAACMDDEMSSADVLSLTNQTLVGFLQPQPADL